MMSGFEVILKPTRFLLNMQRLIILSILITISNAFILVQNEESHLSEDALIQNINSKQNIWIAGKQSIPLERIKRKLMKIEYVKPHEEEDVVEIKELLTIPASFDSRTKWSKCASINNIRDQSDCGSCWAFAAAEAASDRLCIHSNGTINTLLSAEDVLSCCTGCGYGCDGGWPIDAWRWFVTNGYVTGGSYENQYGCKPYSLSPCSVRIGNVTYPECPYYGYSTPKCSNTCTSKTNWPRSYQQDKYFGRSAYAVGRTVAQIQTEILTNGPVEAAFTVYEDFYQYRSGIYKYTAGRSLGGHAVKILGWGSQNGTDYWLIANSWNMYWGERGYFRMIRGVNNCGIEGAITAGLPKV